MSGKYQEKDKKKAAENMSPSLQIIPALRDNYIFLIADKKDKEAWICVDPGESEPVRQFLRTQGQKLSQILLTHHHWDHVDGVAELQEEYSCPVLTSASILRRFSFQGSPFRSLPGYEVEMLDIPGHTQDHVAFYFPEEKWLFSGDTLFLFGCGRFNELTQRYTIDQARKDMFSSLKKLEGLPDDVAVFCGHEYTAKNLDFVWTLPHIPKGLSNLKTQITAQDRTVPRLLEEQKKWNPFMNPKVFFEEDQDQAEFELFVKLREWKDRF